MNDQTAKQSYCGTDSNETKHKGLQLVLSLQAAIHSLGYTKCVYIQPNIPIRPSFNTSHLFRILDFQLAHPIVNLKKQIMGVKQLI